MGNPWIRKHGFCGFCSKPCVWLDAKGKYCSQRCKQQAYRSRRSIAPRYGKDPCRNDSLPSGGASLGG